MTVEGLVREWQSEAMKAVMKFPDDALDLTEGEVTEVKKAGRKNLILTLTNNFSLQCERAIFCTGVGPEKDLTASGVKFLNYPTGPRVTLTGLQHLKNVSGYKLGTYKSAKTLWHYIFAERSA